MIVRRIGGEFWLFDQLAHSAICGDMAAVWGAPPFEQVPEEVQRAAAMHDSGWSEWDRRPRLNPATGQPHRYSDMPEDDYLAIWQRGLARGWAETEVVGLLVSLHAMRFFGHKKRPADRALFQQQQTLQRDTLRAVAGRAAEGEELPEPFATWHAWMFFWDALSLFVCEGWDSPWQSTIPVGGGGEPLEVRVERSEDRTQPGGLVVVEPFPFLHDLLLEAPARIIPAREYAAQAQLDAALNAADHRVSHWSVLSET